MSDTISRQAAIDALGEKPLAWTEGEYELGLQNQWQSDVDALNGLPSAQPERGRWEEKEVSESKAVVEWQSARCSVCGKYHTTPYMYYFSEYNFCPSCGADMRGDRD